MKFEASSADQTSEITALFTSTFAQSWDEQEGILVGNLAHELLTQTEARDLYGFVAMNGSDIIGCILFSRLRFESGLEAFILAPVAVHNDYQKQGVGRKLITFGINQLKEDGVELLMSYGDINFYSKVGFQSVSVEQIEAPFPLQYPHGWIGQSLLGGPIEAIPGKPECVAALNKPVYW